MREPWASLVDCWGGGGELRKPQPRMLGMPTANIILNDEELKVLPLRSGTRQQSPRSLVLLNIVPEALTIATRQEKERKGIQIRKDVKLSLFSDSTILYIEKSLRTTRKL